MNIRSVRWNPGSESPLVPHTAFDLPHAQSVRRYHQSFPEYAPTPLVSLPSLAALTGVASIHVKDESFRFGLNAFKVLGGCYSIGRFIGERLHIPPGELTCSLLTSPRIREQTGPLTFVTATDGNHGRGVAWTAKRLGHKSVVYMPKGSAPERLAHIRQAGAQAQITDLNYDDAVRYANAQAKKNGWILVQDTAWDRYEDIPRWIMEGYTTLALETFEQLGGEEPTHIFLQAGVGAFSGSAAGFFSSVYGGRPSITVLEPDKADCLYRTARAGDGRLHPVTGPMDSMMAGLCCGEPCTLGWEVLKRTASHFISMSDDVAALGMRILGNPAGSDPRVISGESGASSLGLAAALLLDSAKKDLRDELGLDARSRILCISTEGATDEQNYRNVVWGGCL